MLTSRELLVEAITRPVMSTIRSWFTPPATVTSKMRVPRDCWNVFNVEVAAPIVAVWMTPPSVTGLQISPPASAAVLRPPSRTSSR